MTDAGVTVFVKDRQIELAVGEDLFFGREPGPGQITESRTVSWVHGKIAAHADSWSVTSTGSYHGFTVLDDETPSRLVIPRGAGPVTVPFAYAVIAVEDGHQRYILVVQASPFAAPGWAGSWGPPRWPAPGGHGGTETVWEGKRLRNRKGELLQWYRVLVAMCEPRLRLPAFTREDRIPTNKEIAARIGVSPQSIEKHYLSQIREELGLPKYGERMRYAAVTLAINQGLVTSADLAVLDEEG